MLVTGQDFMRSNSRSNAIPVVSSEVETSLIFQRISRDGKPGLADFVRCVAASTALGMTDE